jgi:aerobic-type carbon monoxide dehydrogenase small subunit (CoxS/CutS family)
MTSDATTVTIVVNGQTHSLSVPNTETLLTTLRERLGLTSVRSTCAIGMCGICSIEADGRLMSACLLLTALCDGWSITTSEGLVQNDVLTDRVQQAFVAHSAFQCSFCTPAMVIATRALLQENPEPSRDEIRHFLAGNTCRCGSHPQVIEAIESLTSSTKEQP